MASLMTPSLVLTTDSMARPMAGLDSPVEIDKPGTSGVDPEA